MSPLLARFPLEVSMDLIEVPMLELGVGWSTGQERRERVRGEMVFSNCLM